MVIGFGDFSGDSRALVGDALALFGSLALALYLLSGRRLRARLSLPAYLGVCYSSATLLLWCCVLAGGLPVTGFGSGTWGALFGMALISQHLGHSCYNWGLTNIADDVVYLFVFQWIRDVHNLVVRIVHHWANQVI